MKAIIWGVGGLGVASGASLAYLHSITTVKMFSERTFYYKEVQGEYSKIGSEFAVIDKIKDSVKEEYQKGRVSMMSVHYDNPMWLVDKSKARTALGYSVDSDVSMAEKAKVGLGFSSVNIPRFRATMLTACTWKQNLLYQVYISVLFWKYMRMHANTLKEKKITCVPVCCIYPNGKETLFIPEPDSIENFKFIKTPQPVMNEKGKNFLARCFKPAETQVKPAEKPATPSAAAPASTPPATPPAEKK